jgi:hypothetical protein
MDYKYPRTVHLPQSPGFTNDDERLANVLFFEGQDVVVTEKLDGENSSILFNGTYYARSLDSGGSPWRSYLATEAARIQTYKLPAGYRICGENVFAKHSIEYNDLESYFYAFNIWEDNYCLPWNQTKEWFELLDLKYPKILYQGVFDENIIQEAFENYCNSINREVEGYVVRRSHGFLVGSFSENVCKWVRANHVKTDEHWTKNWVSNKLIHK